MDIKILENGNLELTATDEDRAMIEEAIASGGRNFWCIMGELFEPYFTNGSYELFDAGEANPFVGLTSAPCIAESMNVLDDGTREIEGRCWYFADYQIENELDLFRDGKTVVYTLIA